MNNILQNIDWMTLFAALWTAVFIPTGKQIYEWLKAKKLDRYASILYEEVTKVVKSLYETSVKDLKGTEYWTEETKKEVKELAKIKVLQALSSSAYQMLKESNGDFEEYLDSLIGTALYDVKHTSNTHIST